MKETTKKKKIVNYEDYKMKECRIVTWSQENRADFKRRGWSPEEDALSCESYNPSMEADFVPEPTARDTIVSHTRTPKGTTDHLHEPQIQMLSPMDREDRVLRYKEKRKKKKFEKTIRYASTKAYTKRRPMINGWFEKMREIKAEDQDFNTMLMYYDTG